MKIRVLLIALLLTQPLFARTWTDAGSGLKMEAEFVSADESSVTLSMRGGTVFKMALARLTPEDRAFVQERLQSGVKPPPGAKSVIKEQAAKAEDSFADVQIKNGTVPVSGEAHPALAGVDAAVRAFMAERGIGAATFALSKNGKLLHDRAFGWADKDLKTPLQPGVKMRLASMTKPVVQATVKTLFTAGKLKADDLVFRVLDLQQYPEAQGCDERWQRITIQHLLDHKGGWDRDKSGDFTYNIGIAKTFGLPFDQLRPEHVMRFGLKQKFDFEPGERSAYCNYGYILLVRVIEKISGQRFIDYLHATVCQEASASSFSLSSSDARDRQPGEIWYCYNPEYPHKVVPLPFRVEARDGAGVLACTAADYCRFLEKYSVIGNLRRPGLRYHGTFDGSHPGVTAICHQFDDGTNYAIICNRRNGGKSDWNGDLHKAVEAELAKVIAELK